MTGVGPSTGPIYVRRLVRLPRILEYLRHHRDGLPISELADRFGLPAVELHEDLLAFYAADVDPSLLFGLSRADVLEFRTAEGEETDPTRAAVVLVSDQRPAGELGVEHVGAQELALLYASAIRLQEMEPDNADLAAAIDVLSNTLFDEATDLPRSRSGTSALAPLQTAINQHRRARIVYSRSWDAGVRTRVIEPYQLVSTRRGWEVDAALGPDGGPAGELRTYLVSNVREIELLPDGFDPPSDAAERLARQRATTTVTVCVPHSARWAADIYAESVTATDEDDESVTLELELLPPLAHRVGLLLLASGPESFVVRPADLTDADLVLAADLLEHHREPVSPKS